MHWQTRILRLQNRMRELSEELEPRPLSTAGTDDDDLTTGECAAAAATAFQGLACEDFASPRSAVRLFGRQTVWCTVSLLRRVLREARWQAGDRGLTSTQAEQRLASLAISAIGGADLAL